MIDDVIFVKRDAASLTRQGRNVAESTVKLSIEKDPFISFPYVKYIRL